MQITHCINYDVSVISRVWLRSVTCRSGVDNLLLLFDDFVVAAKSICAPKECLAKAWCARARLGNRLHASHAWLGPTSLHLASDKRPRSSAWGEVQTHIMVGKQTYSSTGPACQMRLITEESHFHVISPQEPSDTRCRF